MVEFYGVADTYEQILNNPEYKEQFIDAPKKYVLLFGLIYKSDQPEHGGWRWHKWGHYIGEKTITTEYLYDEKDINSVVIFHFYEILD
jgi:hypothetical protein